MIAILGHFRHFLSKMGFFLKKKNSFMIRFFNNLTTFRSKNAFFGVPVKLFLNSCNWSQDALKDYTRGRAYLSDMANREGVPIFDSIDEAVAAVVGRCKNGAAV
jgi:hypothetical protein